jgi:hypothetical protein
LFRFFIFSSIAHGLFDRELGWLASMEGGPIGHDVEKLFKDKR